MREGEGESGKRKVEAGKPVEGVQSMKRAIPTKRLVMVCMPALLHVCMCVCRLFICACVCACLSVCLCVCVCVCGVL